MLHWKDQIIKTIEFLRGDCRSKDKYLGRYLEKLSIDRLKCCDSLIFCAHPDDETIGMGIFISRLVQKGEKIGVIFSTNGRGSWKTSNIDARKIARVRLQEAINALGLIGIDSGNILCLGYPDCGLYRYLPSFSEDVVTILRLLKPRKIYVQSIEGGHIDHDTTSYVVQKVCKNVGFKEVFEWAEYNHNYGFNSEKIVFSFKPLNNEVEDYSIALTDDELKIKEEMLNCYRSQDLPKVIRRTEALRESCLDLTDYYMSQLESVRYHERSKIAYSSELL